MDFDTVLRRMKRETFHLGQGRHGKGYWMTSGRHLSVSTHLSHWAPQKRATSSDRSIPYGNGRSSWLISALRRRRSNNICVGFTVFSSVPSCLRNPKMFEPFIKCSGASALSSKSKCKSGAGLCFGPSFCSINFHLPAGKIWEISFNSGPREGSRVWTEDKKNSETKTRQKSLRCNITFRFGLSNICLEPTFTLEKWHFSLLKNRNMGEELDPNRCSL